MTEREQRPRPTVSIGGKAKLSFAPAEAEFVTSTVYVTEDGVAPLIDLTSYLAIKESGSSDDGDVAGVK